MAEGVGVVVAKWAFVGATGAPGCGPARVAEEDVGPLDARGEELGLDGDGVEPAAEGTVTFDAREPQLRGPPFAEVCERVCGTPVAIKEGGASDDLFGEAVG